MFVAFLLCDCPYNMPCQSELENIGHDVFGPNNMPHFRDLAKTLISSGAHSYMFCFMLQLSPWWQWLHSLRKGKEAANDGEDEKVQIRKEEVFEMERTPSLNIQAFRHYQQNP